MSTKESHFLRTSVKKIVKNIRPEKVVLFGSHAYGKPNADSDVDLLVVQRTRLPFAERVRRVSAAVGRHEYPMDYVVLTPSEIRRRRAGFDPFLEEVMERGKVLYERAG